MIIRESNNGCTGIATRDGTCSFILCEEPVNGLEHNNGKILNAVYYMFLASESFRRVILHILVHSCQFQHAYSSRVCGRTRMIPGYFINEEFYGSDYANLQWFSQREWLESDEVGFVSKPPHSFCHDLPPPPGRARKQRLLALVCV